MMNSLSDLLRAARTLTRARAFTAVCVVSLGLGMGVVIAILLLLRIVTATPAHVNDKGLVEVVVRPSGQLRAQAGSAIIDTWSLPDYLDVRDAAGGMAMSGWSRGEGLYQPEDKGPAISVQTMYVSSNYFSTIGVTLPRGSGFTRVDDASRAEPEAVIGHRLWQVRFNSDPNIIGRRVRINQADYAIVGVAPEDFRGHTSGLNDGYYQLWLPLSHHPRLIASPTMRLARDASWFRIIARLPGDTTLAQADAMVQSRLRPSRRAILGHAGQGRRRRAVPPGPAAGANPRRSVHDVRVVWHRPLVVGQTSPA